ncbi:MAG TPA: MFS transporter [Dehalococcoidia bacterium]|nr:MFS transporter [Dehalococcoidia bacterium]
MAQRPALATLLPPPSLKGFQFWMATLAIHLYFVSYGISIVNVPSSLASEPDWVVGIVVGALGISGMISRPLIGIWVDTGGRERWAGIGGMGTAVAFVGYGLSLDPWVMLGFRLLHGVAMALFTTALLAMVAGLIPERQRGVGVGLYQSGNAAAQLYSAPLAVWLATQTSFEVAFLAGALAAGLAFGVGAIVRDREPPGTKAYVPWSQREWVSRSALMPALVFLTMTTTVGAVVAFLPLFAEERDLGNPGLYYTVWGAALFATRFFAGAAGDRFGRKTVMVPSLLGGAVGLFLLAATETGCLMLLSGAIAGVALGGVQVSVVALVVDRAPADARGAAMATYTLAWDIGAVVGGVLLGFIINATSYSLGFALVGILPLGGMVLYVLRISRNDGDRAAVVLSKPAR